MLWPDINPSCISNNLCLDHELYFIRFHLLTEFDEAKRSCRKRLDGHNRRRRKPQPDVMNSASFMTSQQGYIFTTALYFNSPYVIRNIELSVRHIVNHDSPSMLTYCIDRLRYLAACNPPCSLLLQVAHFYLIQQFSFYKIVASGIRIHNDQG